MHWSPELTMDVLSSWLDAMYQYSPGDGKGGLEMGWLPREMILGDEPRLRVPTEFITQVRLRIDQAATSTQSSHSNPNPLHKASEHRQSANAAAGHRGAPEEGAGAPDRIAAAG